MRSTERRVARCPEPHCGGRLLVRQEQTPEGRWEPLLACVLCGRERTVLAFSHSPSALPPPNAAASSGEAS